MLEFKENLYSGTVVGTKAGTRFLISYPDLTLFFSLGRGRSGYEITRSTRFPDPGIHFHALSTLGARESVTGYCYKIVFNSHLEYPTGDCVLSVHSYSM